MATRRLLASVGAAFALLLSAGCASLDHSGQATAAKAAGPQRVVMQVSDNDPGKWNLAFNNARNIQSDLGAKNVEIEIVAYGPGIAMLKGGSAVAPRIDEATLAGVKVVACENTMHAQKLARSDMVSGIDYVSAGVVEIMKRQQEGWSYIRP
ncbi:MAG TPA: DsrE family protein [Usitatibacter sp.]|nr:DsrE family protein [Usitatibacter sp.]